MGAVTSMFWREKDQDNTLTPNSMSPVPKKKFINLARVRIDPDEDQEPHESIYDLKRLERLYGKSKKRQDQFNHYYDYYNH
jgi:hypothetical protein